MRLPVAGEDSEFGEARRSASVWNVENGNGMEYVEDAWIDGGGGEEAQDGQ